MKQDGVFRGIVKNIIGDSAIIATPIGDIIVDNNGYKKGEKVFVGKTETSKYIIVEKYPENIKTKKKADFIVKQNNDLPDYFFVVGNNLVSIKDGEVKWIGDMSQYYGDPETEYKFAFPLDNGIYLNYSRNNMLYVLSYYYEEHELLNKFEFEDYAISKSNQKIIYTYSSYSQIPDTAIVIGDICYAFDTDNYPLRYHVIDLVNETVINEGALAEECGHFISYVIDLFVYNNEIRIISYDDVEEKFIVFKHPGGDWIEFYADIRDTSDRYVWVGYPIEDDQQTTIGYGLRYFDIIEWQSGEFPIFWL